MHFAPNTGLSFVRVVELFPINQSAVTFLQFNFFFFVRFLTLGYACRTTHFLVLAQHRHSELLWVGGARNIHPPHAFYFSVVRLAVGVVFSR